MKIIVLCGLPGCGKTTYAIHLSKQKSNNRYFDVDKVSKKKDFNLTYELNVLISNYYQHEMNIIMDGLFLYNETYESIVKNADPKRKLDFEFHYWEPDVEACLHNDKYRRKVDSEITIKNAKIEEPNIEKLSTLRADSKTSVVKHKTTKKPEYIISYTT